MDTTGNDVDEVTNIESAVLLALAKLSKKRKGCKKVRKTFTGVSRKRIVDFLKTNFPWIDGDIESQVMTALLSCIKTGLVCALVSGRYHLIGPSAKDMATNCILRPSHGPKCSCMGMLKCFSKTCGQTCCLIEKKEFESSRKPCTRRNNTDKAKSPSLGKTRRRMDCGRAHPRVSGVGCAQTSK